MAAARDARTLARAFSATNAIVLPGLVAIALIVYLAIRDGGYLPTLWYPAALFLLALLVLSLAVVPAAGGPPWPALAAVALLAGYAVWSYASIAWAHEQADAWDGANRTALYAIVFALFALWPLRRRGATVLVGGLALALACLALVALLRADAAAQPEDFFVFSRLAWPINYPNATVCLWFIAFWPCVTLAARREVHPLWRATFLAGAVVIGAAALLGQSRGWLFAVPIGVVAFLALSPARVRILWTLIAVGLALVAIGPTVLDVHDALGADRPADEPLSQAVQATLLAAGVAWVLGLAAGYLERRVHVPARARSAAANGTVLAAVAVLAVALVVFVVQVGSPAGWLDDKWEEFKGGAQPTQETARFGQGLGSNRYDFWRVAWHNFERRPIVGVGADNFRHDYLRERHSAEEPYYPHSLVVRTVSQTGLVGGLLLLGASACGLFAASQAIRRRGGLGAAVAAAAATSFVYFLAHASIDWFWEMPVLGCLAWALLGIAIALWPRPAGHPRTRRTRAPLARGALALGATALVAGLLVVSLAAPWLAELESRRAVRVYNGDPADAPRALELLDRAARLNPASTRPRLIAARIGVASGDLRLAGEEYHRVLERDPRDQYAHLALAALASSGDRPAEAKGHASRALALSPLDPVAREAVERLARGDDFTVRDLSRRFATRSAARSR